MAVLVDIEPGAGRVVLVVTAHADDAALFLGGTIARWSSTGWRVVVIRATDDRWDSVGLSEDATIGAARQQFEQAAAALGVDEIVDLGWPTDTLGDASEIALRERIIREIRRLRPYALVTFDPYAMYGEDNMDHVLVARATDEAFWTAQFDKHHPEHLVEGLELHGAFERWYFGRRVTEVSDVVDITGDALDAKVAAARCHQAAMRNLVNQLRMQAATGGYRVPLLDEAWDSGDVAAVVAPMVRRIAAEVGTRHGVGAAEEFRVVRFGGGAEWLEQIGERL